ncbi:MAG: OmpA family protein [candidate division Zixibacteria bacterium]|nr:OmpA family protein [candidate division Zixibacteria bacterium]
MKTTLIGITLALALFAGCGVKKSYVDQQISSSESRTSERVQTVAQQAAATAAEVERLNRLAVELDAKTDKAINKATGFEDYVVLWTGEINFGFDSDELGETGEGVLAEAGRKLEETPKSIVELSGYTDATGSQNYNLMLGQRRSDASKRFLADQFGVMLYRMFDISYGESKPITMADSRGSNSRNRRVEVKVWGPAPNSDGSQSALPIN